MTTTTPGTGALGRVRRALPIVPLQKPLFAWVGVADLALEQVRELPADVTADLRRLQALLAEVPAQVRGLRGTVETKVDEATERAGDLYVQLALRGERLVTQIRRQPSTEAALAEGREAVRKAEAAAVAAGFAARAGERAVEDAVGKLG